MKDQITVDELMVIDHVVAFLTEDIGITAIQFLELKDNILMRLIESELEQVDLE